jgi:hypothetical protein
MYTVIFVEGDTLCNGTLVRPVLHLVIDLGRAGRPSVVLPVDMSNTNRTSSKPCFPYLLLFLKDCYHKLIGILVSPVKPVDLRGATAVGLDVCREIKPSSHRCTTSKQFNAPACRPDVGDDVDASGIRLNTDEVESLTNY